MKKLCLRRKGGSTGVQILVVGGTKFFGIPMIEDFLRDGHDVTIATRGKTQDSFGDKVKRVIFDLSDYSSVEKAFKGKNLEYDMVVDKISYSSNEIKALLDSVQTRRFIHMSTANVYKLDHYNIQEEEFSGDSGVIRWNDRMEASYEDNKRNAERVLCQYYKERSDDWVSVRYPVVLGKNDYTGRLAFYVNRMINQRPMWIDNMDSRLCFINEAEAGKFLSFISLSDYKGAINGASTGTISICEIIRYIENKTGVKAIITKGGEPSPYNRIKNYSLSVNRAENLGYQFSSIVSWIYDLIDSIIQESQRNIPK